jgi:S-adenosylmethionine hydrolase
MRRLITLTTDFGHDDPFAGIMKGVILGLAPDAQIVDITHAIGPQNIRQAAWTLEAAAPCFPAGTVHVAVVDPGVGSERRPLAVQAGEHTFIAPDNGLLTPFLASADDIFELTRSRYFRKPLSATFHGRDVFAPAAAWVAQGTPLSQMGDPVENPVLLDIPQPVFMNGILTGEVIHIDRFGNIATNITRGHLADHFQEEAAQQSLRIGRGSNLRLASHYSDRAPGEAGFLLNSWDRVEVFVREGNARLHFKCEIGSPVIISLETGE